VAALTAGVSTPLPSTAAESAAGHCRPPARALTEPRVDDRPDGFFSD
jgi:hypothetical protein